jgi:hypothetical protein
MIEIKIKDFVSNDAQANKIITEFSSNKMVIKGDTGIGGTTSILNVKDQNIIIISPLTGMIQGKELNRVDHQMFIYQFSVDNFNTYERGLNMGLKIILNTTPEQIIELKKNNPRLFARIMTIPFFVDEFQIYSESEYRTSLNEFYNILFNEHTAHTTLSTATPVYKNLDIPQTFQDDMEVYLIKRIEERKKHITITNINNYWNFVKENCDKGIKVVLHTNDERKIKNLLNTDNLPYTVQCLTGPTLSAKLSQYKSKTLKELNDIEMSRINPDAHVYVLSTKYQIGFDFPFDCAVGIISDQISLVDNKTTNEIVQAYGRCRGNVLAAQLFYRTTGTPDTTIKASEKEISMIDMDDTYLTKIQPHIKAINQRLTYNKKNIITTLTGYGFTTSTDDFDGDVTGNTVDIQTKLTNLINQDEEIQHKQFKLVVEHIKGDDEDYNGFNEKALLLWATALLAGRTQSSYLINQEGRRYDRILARAKNFIDVNDLAYPDKMSEIDKITKYRVADTQIKQAIIDGALCKEFIKGETSYTQATRITADNLFVKAKQVINSLWAIQKVADMNLEAEAERMLNGFAIISEELIEDYFTGIEKELGVDARSLFISKDYTKLKEIDEKSFHKVKFGVPLKNTLRNIVTKLKEYDYTTDEQNQLMAKFESIKKSLIDNKKGIYSTVKMNTYSINAQIDRHKFYVLSMLSLQCAGHTYGFKSTKIDNRDFNTATKTTRQLRGYVPYQLIQIDIKSAFPTFIDEMLDTNIGQDVYNNIVDAEKIDRANAKVKFNSMLNDARKQKSVVKAFYINCGYATDKAENLANITTKEKGSFYRTMTVIEERVVNQYKYLNRLQNPIRLHDALLVYNTPNHHNLDDTMGIYNFEIKEL